jgi:hypothetical protein
VHAIEDFDVSWCSVLRYPGKGHECGLTASALINLHYTFYRLTIPGLSVEGPLDDVVGTNISPYSQVLRPALTLA